MSSKHLSAGSVDPPVVDGFLRLYSMLYCPFAERARLVLKAKNVPHDIANINLVKKPEWYFKIHPEGKVPALIDEGKLIIESVDICDYLDDKYPQNPLYPTDAAAKQRDKEVIQKIGPVLKDFYDLLLSKVTKSPEEWLQTFLTALQPFEDELQARGTPFFGGDKPGMVDYMLWPWAERAPCVAFKLGQTLPIKDDQIPLLRNWRKTMQQDPVAEELYNPPKIYLKLIEIVLKGEEPQYDDMNSDN